ncbi:MAG: hypothetical protein WA156_19210, partial [Methylocystis silviterrae]
MLQQFRKAKLHPFAHLRVRVIAEKSAFVTKPLGARIPKNLPIGRAIRHTSRLQEEKAHDGHMVSGGADLG